MSFFYKDDLNWRAIMSKKTNKKTLLWAAYKKRTFQPALEAKASLTIEAAVALPIFIFITAAFLYLLSVMSIQLDLQSGIEEMHRSVSRKAYMDSRTDFPELPLGAAAVGIYLNSGDLKNKVDSSVISNGAGGINPLLSSYDPQTGIFDIMINYRCNIPVLPDAVAKLLFVQRARGRVWIGRELDSAGSEGSGNNEESDDDKTVYVTETGTVYHTSRECSYLDLSIHAESSGSVDILRNKSGSKYRRCPLCSKGISDSGIVYITDYGENWHSDINCSGLKRTIREKQLKDIGEMKMCSKCGRSH